MTGIHSNQNRSHLFTSESVSEGHPDKPADRIPDRILDAFVEKDPHARVACETMLADQCVVVAGEFKTRRAGDQGLMFGYACDETPGLMPAPIVFAHRLVKRQAEVRKNRTIRWLQPDAKSQVTFRNVHGKPAHIEWLSSRGRMNPPYFGEPVVRLSAGGRIPGGGVKLFTAYLFYQKSDNLSN